ncbi:leucine-rich repeat domain-containing protein [Actinomadura rudentiformis]|uniref:Leucine-rich repeat domain-containing protein n=2 Tax=Actinomadura rudentiformis TaxID=359158 RepID=A0A6H9Z622_9ACTN|nr:leucine-rich repeat domain-containing protein [Actinomadura rudentiformis]
MSEFAGLPVVDVTPFGIDDKQGALDRSPAGVAWRVRTVDYEEFERAFVRFLDEVDSATVTALLFGEWENGGEADPVGLLKAAAGRFPNLRSLFLGDADVWDEWRISCVEYTDITPLLEAFPLLERFGLRGGEGYGQFPVRLEPFRHRHLRELRFESTGLPAQVVRAVAGSDLPKLEHLELWFGTTAYGGDATVADLAPIWSGELLPSLRHLGLQNAEIQDEIAAAVAGAPVVARLESLALSLGTLTDEGAEALLSGQPLTHLRSLDLRHHYLSGSMMKRIEKALPGVKVDLDDQQDGGAFRWTAVADGD